MRLWNRTKKNKSQAQATTELAICATLIIAIFAAILRYSISMNFQQQVQMEAFRKAMKLSRKEKKEVSYTVIKDKRGVNPFDFFGIPEDNRLMAGATVAWISNDLGNLLEIFSLKDRIDSFDYYEINNTTYELPQIKVKAKINQIVFPLKSSIEIKMPILVLENQYKKLKNINASFQRQEDYGGINTQKSFNVSRDITTRLVMYDRPDMEKEILKSLREEQSRRKKEKINGREIIQDLILNILFAVGLSLNDLSDFAHESIESEEELLRYLKYMFLGKGSLEDFLVKVIGITALFFTLQYLGGYLLTKNPEVVSVSIEEGYVPQVEWEQWSSQQGSSEWQAPF
ncbi:MAG: hypothetical protein NC826_05015 [Candidatus Omnitrophica bacterium]|nr:hypothetical protein [Candidatus Omnitrophota bacterium]